MVGRLIMNIDDFKVICSKLNMFQYPERVNDKNNHLKLNLSLECCLHQKIFKKLS